MRGGRSVAPLGRLVLGVPDVLFVPDVPGPFEVLMPPG
jgi:hypothetical protein